MPTRAQLLQFSISFALRDVRVRIGRRCFPLRLPEDTRKQIAADVVQDMRRHGQWLDLDHEVEVRGPGHSTHKNYFGSEGV